MFIDFQFSYLVRWWKPPLKDDSVVWCRKVLWILVHQGCIRCGALDPRLRKWEISPFLGPKSKWEITAKWNLEDVVSWIAWKATKILDPTFYKKNSSTYHDDVNLNITSIQNLISIITSKDHHLKFQPRCFLMAYAFMNCSCFALHLGDGWTIGCL